jgi:predicted RNase H-like HicB family nuclease
MLVSTSHWKFAHSPLGQYFKVMERFRRGSIAAVGGIMQPHAFKVPVTAPVFVECEFWREDDGWIGRCPELSLWVQGGGFEYAKRKMEEALREHVVSLLCSTASNVRAA